jgi:hypothetical protein
MGKTLYDKLWDSHVIHVEADGTTLLHIDRQLLHEVTSAQAFEGLRQTGRPVWRKSANLAVCDHNVPTTNRKNGIADPVSKLQVDTRSRRSGPAHDHRPSSPFPATIDLEAQLVRTPDGDEYKFEISAFRKKCLVSGLDETGLALRYADEIREFESQRLTEQPWLDSIAR